MATEQPQFEASESRQSSLQDTKTQQNKAVAAAKEQAGSAASSSKRKRPRKNTIENKPISADNDSEDIKLHVDADWSDDDKDDKEPTAKRVAAEGDESGPVSVKKTSGGPLENFTVRAVVTRKDVDVIFEHRSGAKEELETETSTSITIIAGKDDPDIVVDRVLIIKGPIEGVTAAYKVITQGMLVIKQSTAASSTTAKSATADSKQKHKEKEKQPDNSDAAAHGQGENQAEDEDSQMEDNAAANSAAAAANDGFNEHDDEDSEDDDDDGNDQNKDEDDEYNSNHDEDDEIHDDGAEAAIGATDSAADASKNAEGKIASPAASDSGNANSKKNADSKGKRDTPNDRVTLRVLVPHKCVGSIMGHGGKTINHIRDTASVSIHTSENTLPRSTERIVAVIGAPESIQKAIGLIAQALTKDMASYNSPECYVPAANLPSAMTVETHFRKRKDNSINNNNNNTSSNKRFGYGHNDHHGSNRGHGNKGGSFRHHHNNSNNNNNNNSGYSHGRYQNHYSGNQRPHGSGSGFNRGGSSNNSGRNDRFSRNSSDRQGGRPRPPNAVSQVNRLPVGGNNSGGSQGQYSSGYRGGSSHGGRSSHGSAVPKNTAYSGYVVPPTTSYPAYGSQGAGAASMGNGGIGGGRYGSGMAPVSPASANNAYGGSYASAPAPYQLASPVGYAYSAAPMQSMYGNRPAQSPHQYPSRGGNRQHMQQQQHQQHQHQRQHQQQQYQGQYQQQNQHYQSPMAMGGVASVGAAAGGAAASAGQTIQKIYVSADKVGAVIGRRGETINEIRQTTSARVDIQDSAHGNKERLIVITGGYEQVHSAYYMIQNKLATARPAGMRP
ncbi:RNA binding protein, heterogenous nuclear RNP-K like protein [Coemansia erecta]|nr:RNA binding protein, heterogenous nuclear RNP-K like protein [Coemansia erecta]